MKKIISSCLLIAILLMLSSCSTKKDNITINNAKNIIKITIKTKPGNDRSIKSTENKSRITEIANYINGLDLKKITKNPNEYTGGAYIITLYFDDKTSTEYVHFGNMFFKESGKDWYEMSYNQAEELDDIYNSLDNK